ncbi:MAG: RNA polymerase sigma factor [Verrucomicrobiaceae bacterium]
MALEVHHFPETRWTMVLALRGGGNEATASRALADLCRVYWRPLYTHARKKGNSPEDAEDLTQSFIMHVLKRSVLEQADRMVGKLRTFLLASFDHHIHAVHRGNKAQHRGGRLEIVSLDQLREAERELSVPDKRQRTAEQYFEQQCALALVDAAMNLLAEEQEAAGHREEFAVLRHEMDPRSSPDERGQAALAAQLNMSHEQLRQRLSILRVRFRKLVRALIRETLHKPTEKKVDEELMFLRSALTD